MVDSNLGYGREFGFYNNLIVRAAKIFRRGRHKKYPTKSTPTWLDTGLRAMAPAEQCEGRITDIGENGGGALQIEQCYSKKNNRESMEIDLTAFMFDQYKCILVIVNFNITADSGPKGSI